MDDWNKNFQRQIWKHYGDKPFPKELEKLIQCVTDSYDTYEKEHKLLNRIMDLSSQELFDANAELRKRNEELDRFVYSTSHDLRAPLTSILGLLQLIQLSENGANTDEYLNQIKFTTQQLDSFIQDIVNYMHNKKSEVEYVEIDFKKLISDCFDKLNYMTATSSIEKIIQIKTTVPFYSDPQRLDNLFSNLISNSIKYSRTENASPFVKITIKANEKNAFIRVEDNGQGIDEIHIDKIFNMFYRASAKSKGSGIGLYIVKEIVVKLGGTISVNSQLDKGSIFEITVPNKSDQLFRKLSSKSS